MRNRFAVLVLSIALLLSVSMVFAQTAEVTIPDELPAGVTITYWHEWSQAQQETITKVITDFNQTNPYGITVEEVPLGTSGAVNDQLTTAIVSGDLPNLSGAIFITNAQSYYLDGVLVPLDAYYNDPKWGFTEEEKADLNQSLLDINRVAGEPFNGQMLIWPTGMSANVLAVNMDMLNELGYDAPPTNLQDFHDIACAANELTGPNDGDVQGFPIRIDAFDLYSYIQANGGTIYDADAGQYNFTNEGAVSTLQFFKDLNAEGCAYIPDSPFANTADFAFGLNPMAMSSSVGVPFINGDIASSGSGIENWVMTTVPWSDENRTMQVYLRSMAMFVSSPEEQLASWLFLKYLASTDVQVAWTEGVQYQPYTYSGLEGLSEDFLNRIPQFTDVRDLLLDEGVHIWSVPSLLVQDQVNDVVEEMITAVVVNGEDVATAAAAAEAEANELLAEAMADMS
ncbi:MAG: extracellular solute-binding protein [Anaerolineae bacterium]|nr:extracellular solute-binding protein [Anaerolineae bacterium]